MSDTTVETQDTGEIRLSLADIENAVKVIDYAADQGAFRGWETIEQVLTVRQRLNVFLDAAKVHASPESAETAATSETPAVEAPAA